MFVNNVCAFMDALGPANAPIIMQLSIAPWPSDDVRNQFIQDLTKIDMKELNDYERS